MGKTAASRSFASASVVAAAITLPVLDVRAVHVCMCQLLIVTQCTISLVSTRSTPAGEQQGIGIAHYPYDDEWSNYPDEKNKCFL